MTKKYNCIFCNNTFNKSKYCYRHIVTHYNNNFKIIDFHKKNIEINQKYENLSQNAKKSKCCILMLSCKKRINDAIAQLALFKKYEFKNLTMKVFIGDLGIKTDYEKDNIVYLKCPDNYESLPKKVHAALKYLDNNYNFDYVFKTDEDIKINYQNLYICFLDQIYNKIDYGGFLVDHPAFHDSYHFNKCENESINNTAVVIPFSGEYCVGGGYFLNLNKFKLLLNNYINFHLKTNILCEDLITGRICTLNKIKAVKIDIHKFVFWDF